MAGGEIAYHGRILVYTVKPVRSELIVVATRELTLPVSVSLRPDVIITPEEIVIVSARMPRSLSHTGNVTRSVTRQGGITRSVILYT